MRVATLLAAFSPAAAISLPRNAPRIDECGRYPSGRGYARVSLARTLCGAPLTLPTQKQPTQRSRAVPVIFHRSGVAGLDKRVTYAAPKAAYYAIPKV